MCKKEHFTIEDLEGLKFDAFSFDDTAECYSFSLNKGSIEVCCFWRVLVEGKILGTSLDVGFDHWMNQFQSPEGPLKEHLFEKKIETAFARQPTGDLVVEMEGGVTFEAIKDHGALEPWEVRTNSGAWLYPDAWGEINGWKSTDVPEETHNK